MTTYELLEQKNKWTDNDESFKQVKRILTSGDLVKFAKYKADPHENEGSMSFAFSYVEATKPVPDSAVTEIIDTKQWGKD